MFIGKMSWGHTENGAVIGYKPFKRVFTCTILQMGHMTLTLHASFCIHFVLKSKQLSLALLIRIKEMDGEKNLKCYEGKWSCGLSSELETTSNFNQIDFSVKLRSEWTSPTDEIKLLLGDYAVDVRIHPLFGNKDYKHWLKDAYSMKQQL